MRFMTPVELCRLAVFFGLAGLVFLTGGCGLLGPQARQTPEGEQLDAFLSAGDVSYAFDKEALYQSLGAVQEYRVQTGDLLELQMPAAVQVVTDELAESGEIEQVRTFTCRVGADGMIPLPIVGAIAAAGKTVLEIEAAAKAAYYPRYVVSPPAVVMKVTEYKTQVVSVTGAVRKPGSYRLRSDQMTLVSLLMEAGGIAESGAAVIRISDPAGGPAGEPILMPVKGMNIPFADVSLSAGTVVEVTGLEEQVFTVLGLVKQPGTYPYPANAHFSLPQALAFSGGLHVGADPRFVHVYRPDASGKIFDAVFRIEPGEDFARAMAVAVKPGDVISVEQTPDTRRNLILSDVLQLRASVGYAFTQ